MSTDNYCQLLTRSLQKKKSDLQLALDNLTYNYNEIKRKYKSLECEYHALLLSQSSCLSELQEKKRENSILFAEISTLKHRLVLTPGRLYAQMPDWEERGGPVTPLNIDKIGRFAYSSPHQRLTRQLDDSRPTKYSPNYDSKNGVTNRLLFHPLEGITYGSSAGRQEQDQEAKAEAEMLRAQRDRAVEELGLLTSKLNQLRRDHSLLQHQLDDAMRTKPPAFL